MSKLPRWTHAGAASRLDAELMSNGPQRQIGLSLDALDPRLRQIKCRLLIDC